MLLFVLDQAFLHSSQVLATKYRTQLALLASWVEQQVEKRRSQPVMRSLLLFVQLLCMNNKFCIYDDLLSAAKSFKPRFYYYMNKLGSNTCMSWN